MITPSIDRNLSFRECFNFADNPVMLVVSMPDGVAGGSMYQVVVELYLKEQEEAAYTFKMETHIGGTVYIDLSSALRSHLNILDYDAAVVTETAETLTYTQARFYAKVYISYLRDGRVVNDTDAAVYHPQNGGAGYYAYGYHGGISDFDRMMLSTHPGEDLNDTGNGVQSDNSNFWAKNMRLSYKPQSGERWGLGDMVLTSVFETGTESNTDSSGNSYTSYWQKPVTKVSVVSQSDSPGLPDDHFHFLFVNSLGVFETVSAVSKESLSYEHEEVETLKRVSIPAYHAQQDIISAASSPRAIWQMSSGYTTRQWADWWTNEFLASKRLWVRMEVDDIIVQTDADGNKSFIRMKTKKWVPCVVEPDNESVLIYNKADQQIPHVDFTVKVAAKGSLMNHISVVNI